MAKTRQTTTLVNLRMKDDLLEELKGVKKLTGKSLTDQIHEGCWQLVRKQKPKLDKLAKFRTNLFGKTEVA